MIEKDIFFILVQIEEAHTALWPQGVIELGIPQKDITDRCQRAIDFEKKDVCGNDRFLVVVDPWTNDFANRYRAWPDKYYLLQDKKIVAKSTYGSKKDALLDVDCVDLIESL